MDLFGDLPAAKKTSSTSGGGRGRGTATDDAPSDDLFGGLPGAASSSSTNATSTKLNASTVDTSNMTEKRKTPTTKTTTTTVAASEGKSLVSSLGKAGTSMAFVPQAIARKKKKVSQQQQKQQSTKQVKTKDGTKLEGSIVVVDAKQSVEAAAHDVGKSSTVDTSNETLPEDTNSHLIDTTTNNQNEEEELEPYLENEPESLRLLHASVTHPYDPHCPNDYLAYREHKKTEQVRKDMQRSALERLDQQEKLRKKIEEERRKIDESGDLDRMVESRFGSGGVVGEGAAHSSATAEGGRGRGRGRGMSNLPAWLLKKQQAEREARGEGITQSLGTSKEPKNTQQPSPDSCTVALFNMVAPGDIDDELATEVKEECEEQCGKVLDVHVMDATSSEEYVRVDVTFENAASASEAVKIFNGRMFGDRKITARMKGGR